VYTPAGYEDEPDRRYPCVYVIQGFTGQVDMRWNREAFRRTFPESIDEVVAFVDARLRTHARRERRGAPGQVQRRLPRDGRPDAAG
jgi:hypothetical protein